MAAARSDRARLRLDQSQLVPHSALAVAMLAFGVVLIAIWFGPAPSGMTSRFAEEARRLYLAAFLAGWLVVSFALLWAGSLLVPAIVPPTLN